MNNEHQESKETRIEARIDRTAASGLQVGAGGNLAFVNADQLMEFSKMMSISQVAIPKHLRGNPGACLAITMQASEWGMSSFAVANKSYSVNDRLAYEAQLINAVILKRAPIKGRFKIEYSGDGQSRKCKVSATLTDGEVVSYESPPIGSIKVKNSPLWTSDPDQQLFYFSSRSMCRRHFPDVLLGVYTPDEVQELEPRDITPQASASVLFKAPPALEQKAENAPTYPGEALEDLEALMQRDDVSMAQLNAVLLNNEAIAEMCDEPRELPSAVVHQTVTEWASIIKLVKGGQGV